jgi:PAS domain S-box-containing protein
LKTVIIGGGKGCVAILDLATGAFLRELTLDVHRVVDLDPQASGMLRAVELGVPTGDDFVAAMSIPGLELVIELTGNEAVLKKLYDLLPNEVRLIDHTMAHVFWELANAQQEQEWHLVEITKLEEKIETERRLLQSIFDTMPDLIVVFDDLKQALHTNAAFLEFVSAPADSVVGAAYDSLLDQTELAAALPEISGILDEVIQTGRPRSLVWQTAHPQEAYWEITHTPILDQTGRLKGVVGTWHRITEKVMLHREIEQAEQQFKSFIDSANDWISIKDLEGRYLTVNPVCARAFNLKPEDFAGRKPEDILPATVAERIRSHDLEVIRSNKYHTYNEVYRTEGREHHFQTVRFPLTDHGDNIIGVCTIARDVTSEKELNDQLVQAAKLAAVGRLAAGIAHEINNPLTGILAFAEDMMEDLANEHPHHSDLAVIVRETIRCREIVRNLLDFARLEQLDLALHHPNEVIEEALQLVHKLPQFRNISITRNLGEALPSISCDKQQMQQVILNLMLNAADAMNGQGTIDLITDYDPADDKCIITVDDDGPGIPEALLDKVFEPFFSTKGTNGLGLAVSWGIVERHKGILEAHRAPSGGARFEIILPAAAAPGPNDNGD